MRHAAGFKIATARNNNKIGSSERERGIRSGKYEVNIQNTTSEQNGVNKETHTQERERERENLNISQCKQTHHQNIHTHTHAYTSRTIKQQEQQQQQQHSAATFIIQRNQRARAREEERKRRQPRVYSLSVSLVCSSVPPPVCVSRRLSRHKRVSCESKRQ